MQYYETIWNHTITDEPILMYSEINDKRYEIRRLEIFKDGRSILLDATDLLELIEAPFPESFDEINQEEEFQVTELCKEEFEQKLAEYGFNDKQ